MGNAVHGRHCAIFANEFDISNYLNKASANRNAPELEQTTFQDAARTYVAIFQEGSIELGGFFSHDEVNLDTAEDVFKAALGSSTNRVVTIAPEGGSTFGNRAILCDAVETKHEIDSMAAGLVTTMASFRGDVQHGVLLAHKASRTSTGNGTAVDNTASSGNGAVGHLHVFSQSGTTPTLDVKIQHSLDDSTYVDLMTFTQATDVTSERLTTTGTTAVLQVETATVTGGATASANVIVTVTGSGITGSPLATNVAVLNGDSASDVGGKIRTALNAVTAITSVYTVGGSGADITLTRITAAANDATLNIAIDGTTNSTGVPDAATSANTTAGVLGDQVYRYVRESRTIGGSATPTFNYAVAFARN